MLCTLCCPPSHFKTTPCIHASPCTLLHHEWPPLILLYFASIWTWRLLNQNCYCMAIGGVILLQSVTSTKETAKEYNGRIDLQTNLGILREKGSYIVISNIVWLLAETNIWYVKYLSILTCQNLFIYLLLSFFHRTHCCFRCGKKSMCHFRPWQMLSVVTRYLKVSSLPMLIVIEYCVMCLSDQGWKLCFLDCKLQQSNAFNSTYLITPSMLCLLYLFMNLALFWK